MATKRLLIGDRQKVRDSFGKSETDVCEYIEIVTRWFKTQPHLPEIPPNALIESFLVTSKFSVERTKQCLDMYYTIRSVIPEIFRNKTPSSPDMQITAKAVQYFPLSKLTKELYRVVVCKAVGETSDFNAYNCIAHLINTNEVRLHEEINLGDVFIMDCEKLKMGHLLKLTPIHLKKASIVLEGVFSNRIKGIHIVNAKPLVDKLVVMLKLVLKQKLIERIHVHSTIDTLAEYIPKEVLPADYGGDDRSLSELQASIEFKIVANKNCSVDGCRNTVGSPGVSFFRCPKDVERCQICKNALGFIGTHRYADIIPLQSYNRIKICSLHFSADSFSNECKTRLHNHAVPSLLIPTKNSRIDLWMLKLEEYKERFEFLDKINVNENRRPTPLENNDVLGYYGNFKKLDID